MPPQRKPSPASDVVPDFYGEIDETDMTDFAIASHFRLADGQPHDSSGCRGEEGGP